MESVLPLEGEDKDLWTGRGKKKKKLAITSLIFSLWTQNCKSRQ